MGRIALSITHESDYAVAVAFGVRTAGGRYVFPLDIDERIDERERKLLARLERLGALHEANQRAGTEGANGAADDPRDEEEAADG
jgi:hypothetical protein